MADAPGFRLEPSTIITDVHTLAQEMGARRLRVDRSRWGETDERPDCWIEAGYGCGEIKIRTSVPTLVYRADVARVQMDDVVDLFSRLLDWNPEEGPQ